MGLSITSNAVSDLSGEALRTSLEGKVSRRSRAAKQPQLLAAVDLSQIDRRHAHRYEGEPVGYRKAGKRSICEQAGKGTVVYFAQEAVWS